MKPKSRTSDSGVPPLLRSAPGTGGPATGSRPLIVIGGAPRSVVNREAHVDPYLFWTDYYRKHDESPGELHETVRLLGANERMVDVEAALKGYLRNHGNNAEAWMYRAMAMAIQVNRGSLSEKRDALNYAADLAQRSHNPNDLVSVADTMLLMGQLDRVGVLLDEAASRVPHRREPLEMSMLLARKLEDSARMSASVDKLLSLGWPGEDDLVRTECRRQIESFAGILRDHGRNPEAARLVDGLAASLTRDVFIRLTWDGNADYDLAVDEPLGVTASYNLPRTVFGGSILKNGFGSHPEEVYVCPRGFDGDYTVHIRTIYTDPAKPVLRLRLETIVHEGTTQEKREVHELKPDRVGSTFVVHLTGGRRKTVLPYIDPLAGRIEYQAVRPAPKHPRRPRNPRTGGPAGAPKAGPANAGAASPRP